MERPNNNDGPLTRERFEYLWARAHRDYKGRTEAGLRSVMAMENGQTVLWVESPAWAEGAER